MRSGLGSNDVCAQSSVNTIHIGAVADVRRGGDGVGVVDILRLGQVGRSGRAVVRPVVQTAVF